MSIHQMIRESRQRLDMTEELFAKAVGVTRGAVQQWEKAKAPGPNAAACGALPRCCDVAWRAAVRRLEHAGNSLALGSTFGFHGRGW
jgi:DNA-binding XRE family transcriptional regulator